MILDAAEGAELLCGVHDEVDADALADAVARANTAPDHDAVLIDKLRRHRVVPGTCIVVPAGTIHAIGPGIMMMEIQQPVDRTFRLYDYGSGRELHVREALAATHLRQQPLVWDPSEPARRLCGEHVQLQPQRGAGRVGASGGMEVVLAVGGAVEVTAGAERERLDPGDLLLVRSDAIVQANADTLWVRAGLTRQ